MIYLIIIFIFLIYLIASIIILTRKIKPYFARMDFDKNAFKTSIFISYDDIKEKYARKEYTFYSKKNQIKAYLYGANNTKGLVVYVHGLCAGHQCYLSDIISLVNHGYKVFTYDFTGTGASSGKRIKGLLQQEIDLKACLNFLTNNSKFKNDNFLLYGHSMGAYAIARNQGYVKNIKSSVIISGFDNPFTVLLNLAKKEIKHYKLVYLPLIIAIIINQGMPINKNAHKKISISTAPILIIHGTNDKIVPFKTMSITAYKNKIKNANAKYLNISEKYHDTHNSIIASTECKLYQEQKEKIYKNILEQTKNESLAQKAFLEDLDKFKYNSANEKLMNVIDNFFQESLK